MQSRFNWVSKLMATVTVLTGLLLFHSLAQAQSLPTRNPTGGGDLTPENHVQHLSADQRREIEIRLQNNQQILTNNGLLVNDGAPPMFHWPVRKASHVTDPGVDAISNFVDHDPSVPNQLLDYFCGARTYDLSGGYNHQGLDIFASPFSWNKMDSNDVEIVAAAPGTIIGKDDGNSDMSCGFSNQLWNAVYIQHDDGSVAWYGHMKKNTLTGKLVGEPVDTGEFLGVMGSSGSSTEPHLHWELYDAQGNLVDPYSGTCNMLNANSLWSPPQPAYYVPRVNLIATHVVPPQYNTCPQLANQNFNNTFQAGNPLIVSAHYRDQQNSTPSSFFIHRPDGSSYDSWMFSPTTPHYAASWWYWARGNFNQFDPTGIWNYRLEFESTVTEHEFYLVDSCATDAIVAPQIVTGTKAIGATNTITTQGSVEIDSNGEMTLLATNSIQLGNGFTVNNNGRLRVRNVSVCT